MKNASKITKLLCVLCVASVSYTSIRGDCRQPEDTLPEWMPISRGIGVLLGDESCSIALKLARETELQIYVQLLHEKDLEAGRRSIDAAGFYGTRIYVEYGSLEKIHLADNLADVVIALGEAAKVSRSEVLRVLHPLGKAWLDGEELVKPLPEGIDDWSHPYHGPDNNPQSNDRVARAPYLTQFLANPRWAPMPQLTVASAGRVFKAFGNLAFKEREESWLNTLVALNGYNGTILWKRDLPSGLMIHRNIMVATPNTLYLADDKSCKQFDTVTGRFKDEIIPPVEITGGTSWKWLALENGILYGLIGEEDEKDPPVGWQWKGHGWPWGFMSKGFSQPEISWGFGRTLLAMDLKTREILWHHQEAEPADTRAVCMKGGRIYIFRSGSYLAALDTGTGAEIWRKNPDNAPRLFEVFNHYEHRNGPGTSWRSVAYLKCSDDALFFAGPPVDGLLAVSAEDGRILWKNPYDNYMLINREDGLYGISGPWGSDISRKFDPLTGRILAEPMLGRFSCARPTGAVDAIFFRARGGTVRLDVASNRPQWLSPVRPQCQDGVTIANGHLYFWPMSCDCQLTLYGISCLGPAGDFVFNQQATDLERLEQAVPDLSDVLALPQSAADWPAFRADNARSITSRAVVPKTGRLLWQYTPNTAVKPTAPVAAGGLVFVGGADGIVRALRASTGQEQWKAYTGGGIRFPPSLWQGRALVGSGDGWVYAFEAVTGRRLWRFRVAPAERKIPVYGSLVSTWPAAGGVLVEDGVAYVAAGIVNYDGTHVYALDAETGAIRWQNSSSGHLDPASQTGVSVQGPPLLHAGKLYMPGGNAASPAVYDVANGECLNRPDQFQRCESYDSRGSEPFLIGDHVVVCGPPLYGDPKFPVQDRDVINKMLVASTGARDVVWLENRRLLCFPSIEKRLLNHCVGNNKFVTSHVHPTWGGFNIPGKPLWEYECEDSIALAVTANTVVIAGNSDIVALDLERGEQLWLHPLPDSPVPWGLAIDGEGRVHVTLQDGRVLCFG